MTYSEGPISRPAADVGHAGNWTDLRVVVTGAASGVGLACAELLGRRGAQLVLCDSDPVGLAAAARSARALARQCDVTSDAAAAVLAAELWRLLPSLDVLINAAGKSYIRTLGMMRMTRALLPMMIHGDGRRAEVFNVASAGADADQPGYFPYAASAGAFERLSKAIAAEVQGTGVVLTSLNGGSADAPADPQRTAARIVAMIEATVLGRPGRPLAARR